MGGLFLVSDNERTKLSGADALKGVALIYALLSGYYYFMLGHYYATVIALVPVADGIDSIEVDGFWAVFESPLWFLPDDFNNVLGLLGAPLYPLMFSGLVIVGVGRIMGRMDGFIAPGKRRLAEAFLLQVLVMVWVIGAPFVRFLDAPALS